MQVRLPRKIFVIILAVILFAVLGAYFSLLQDSQRRKRLTSEVLANVTNTEVRRSADSESGKEISVDTSVTFEYEIDGQKYLRKVRMSKNAAIPFIPWGKAKVCYDPTNLKTVEEAELFPESFTCGGD